MAERTKKELVSSFNLNEQEKCGKNSYRMEARPNRNYAPQNNFKRLNDYILC